MDFSDMLKGIRRKPGTYRAFREGWNGKVLGDEMFIYVEPAKIIPNKVIRPPQKEWLEGNDMVINDHFVMYSHKTFTEWSPSQLDLFALDWIIVI